MESATLTTAVDQARQMAADIGPAADLVEQIMAAIPDATFMWHDSYFQACLNLSDQGTREAMAVAARLMAPVEKDQDDDFLTLVRRFGSVRVQVFASRDEVCERVQVGTEKVEKRTVVTPAVETVEEVEEPVYEWRCTPLLAAVVAR